MRPIKFVLCLIFIVQAGIASSSINDFSNLLAESELVFSKPENYEELPPGANDVLNYEKAIRSPDQQLEIRFAIRPINRMTIDYEDPHGAVPDPNHIFPLVFESLISRLSQGRYSPSREYSSEDAKKYFNADWAAVAVFDASPEFKTNFKQGFALALHKSRVSDAYIVFLYNNYSEVKPLIDQAMTSLTYRE